MTYGFGSGTPDPLVVEDGTFTDLTVTGSFTSPGIDDNATSTQVTITDSNATFSVDVGTAAGKRLRLGATPRTDWSSAYEVLEIGERSAIMSAAAGSVLFLGSNWYLDGSYKYRGNGEAAQYLVNSAGAHVFRVAPANASGSGAAITWSEVLSLSNDLSSHFADKITSGGPVVVASYTVATVPSASGVGAGGHIFVTDETGGATGAYSDGTNWRRYSDRAIVS